jgi:transcription elongation factor GreA-like protein
MNLSTSHVDYVYNVWNSTEQYYECILRTYNICRHFDESNFVFQEKWEICKLQVGQQD